MRLQGPPLRIRKDWMENPRRVGFRAKALAAGGERKAQIAWRRVRARVVVWHLQPHARAFLPWRERAVAGELGLIARQTCIQIGNTQFPNSAPLLLSKLRFKLKLCPANG